MFQGGSRFNRYAILHSVSELFQGGSRFNRDTTYCFREVPDLIGILHSVSEWFQI
jgi:hypothetical protein